MFQHKINERIKIVFVLVIIFFITIIGKVFYIQVVSYKKLNKYANELWSRNLPLEANRGYIYDRNKNVLAGNITTTSLVLIPNQIKDKENTAKLLAGILKTSYKDMLKHVSKKTSIERVHPEGRRLSNDVADEIDKLKIEGVYLVKESKRDYPYDTYMSHTLGFVGIDNQGLSGLELTYDEYLTGKYGAIKYFSDAKGNKLNLSQIYEQPQDGMNITLTIDIRIQEALERELDNAVKKYNPDGIWGIIMNPKTGEILAISSRPNFSPVNYKNYSLSDINRNIPIWMTYEPGSTFKIITLSAALNENLIDLDNDHFYDSGSVKIGGSTIHCWKHGGHGSQTLLEVVENSCNTGFVNIGLKLGKEKLFKYISDFGFGMKTGIELPGEENGIIFNPSKIGELETATTAFGQGVSVTPLQQITAVSASVNGGILYKPYIVKSINDPETNQVIKEYKPTKVRQVISSEASDKVKYALESVVARGTGHNAYIPDYRVGGKTGTAQKVKDGSYISGNYITSFIGILPSNDPEIVIYIAVDNAKGVVQYGGTVAAPIAREVMKSIITILDIKKDKDGISKEDIPLDKKYIEVPNVVGLSLKEARLKLKGFTIKEEGKGKIIYQSPSSGTKLEEGSVVRIYLN
jgi:stage V sporulation protein D (sporulation-specific penicillin-binding protein)